MKSSPTHAASWERRLRRISGCTANVILTVACHASASPAFTDSRARKGLPRHMQHHGSVDCDENYAGYSSLSLAFPLIEDNVMPCMSSLRRGYVTFGSSQPSSTSRGCAFQVAFWYTTHVGNKARPTAWIHVFRSPQHYACAIKTHPGTRSFAACCVPGAQ